MSEIDKSTTQIMYDELEDGIGFGDYKKKHEDDFFDRSLYEFVLNVLKKKDLKRSDVIKGSDLERTFGYHLINGRRKANRENLIRISFGLCLNSREAIKLFEAAGKSKLDPRKLNEAAAIRCLNRGYSYLEYQWFLDEFVKDE